jgi:hypothetical protein
LATYLQLGLMPKIDFMQDAEINQWYQDAKTMFL